MNDGDEMTIKYVKILTANFKNGFEFVVASAYLASVLLGKNIYVPSKGKEILDFDFEKCFENNEILVADKPA